MQDFKLKLRGFTGIKKGMGLDEIELDFTGLTGLVALAGQNGNGKTTILDNLHPFRALASRAGALQNHCFLRDSTKELSFTYQGDEFRTLIKIDPESGKSGKQEGFIWKNGEPQVNGKVKEYDAYITELFGTPNLFFNSVFAAQGADKMSDLTTGDLKKLFSEFLRLDQLVEYEETAKQAANRIGQQLDALAREENRLQTLVTDKEAQAKLLPGVLDKITILEEVTLPGAKGKAELLRKEIQEMKDNLAAEETTRKRIADLTAEETSINAEIEHDKTATEKKLVVLRDKVKALNVKIKAAEQVLEQQQSIVQASDRVKEIDRQIEQERGQLEPLDIELDRLKTQAAENEKSLAAHNAERDRLNADPIIQRLENRLEVLKRDAADLDKRDPSCKSETCSFIVRAVRAKAEIPICEDELADALANQRAMLRCKDETIKALKDVMAADQELIDNETKSVLDCRSSITVLGKERISLAPMAEKLPEIKVAASELSTLREQKAELTTEGVNIKSELDGRTAFKMGRLDNIILTRTTLEKSIGPSAKDDIKAADVRLGAVERDIETIQENLAEHKSQVVILEKEKAELALAQEDLKTTQDESATLRNDMVEWRYIQNACGKDGLRALEIDSVAPSISGYANDILAKTFGPAHTVKFRTQDENGKEVLDILVIREDGTETALDNLSGGQQVWNLKALRLAMTLISKERSGRNFVSSMADEEDGALDAENAQNFIRMYQSFMKTGGFDTCFYISHRPECVAMADHVVELRQGGVTIH